MSRGLGTTSRGTSRQLASAVRESSPTLASVFSSVSSGSHGCYGFSLPLPFPFSQCSDSDKKCHLWTAMDLGFFVVMGVIGGLLGATFNCLNKRLAKYRMRNVHPKPKLVRYLHSRLPPACCGSLSLVCAAPSLPRSRPCLHGFDFSSKTENLNTAMHLPYLTGQRAEPA